jgi:hypothetical protein
MLKKVIRVEVGRTYIPASGLPGLTMITELLYAFAQARSNDIALSFDGSFTDISSIFLSLVLVKWLKVGLL